MRPSISLGRLARLGSLLVVASFPSAGCAGKSFSRGDDGASANGSGMDSGGTGGTSSGSGGSAQSSGGTLGAGNATGAGASSGGSGNLGANGGSDVGGSTEPGKGGSGASATGGSSGATGGSGGSGAMPSCANVVCPSIPVTCEKIVQPPDECCPICPDTGCGECVEPACKENEHSETIPGDCCPSCVANPPDACEQGQKTYDELRAALIDKYGSSGCKNSWECTLVAENNACAASCPVALPTATAANFTNNLENAALECATCDIPEPEPCPDAIATCVNGKCLAAGR